MNAGCRRNTRMAPQRDYMLGEKCCGEDQVIRGNRYGHAESLGVEGGNNSRSNSDSGSSVDVKLYVALESSGTSASASHYPGYCRQDGEPGRPRIGSDVIGGRCPHHVKFGDSEWGNADRPTNQIRVPYQVRIRRISALEDMAILSPSSSSNPSVPSSYVCRRN